MQNKETIKPFLFILWFYMIILPCFLHSWIIPSNNNGNVPECAYFFSEPNFQGYNLSARDGRDFFQLNQNFYETNTTLQNWDKLTSGIQLQEGCVIYACSEAYLDGVCTSFTEDQSHLKPPWYQNISSFSCNCYKDCGEYKCNQIELSETECGRAFIEPGCNTCQRVYLTLKPSNVTYIGEYENGITAVVLNSGCILTTYEENDFEGETATFQEGVHNNWTTKLGSYECVCDFNSILNKKHLPEDTNNPVMLDMPKTVEEISLLLDGKHRRHKGLLSALRSLKSRRSAKNAYILLLGLTGSGKSSTINILFDNVTIAEVGSYGSTTSEIIEYRVSVPVDEFGIKNSELRIIDTPGLGDTRGFQFDAQFLASLDDWLEKHEELRNKIPNIVLIFARFDSNRIVGESSDFVKALRGLDNFRDRLFDKHYSNIILVLTHFMQGAKKFKKNPSLKIDAFKKLIEEHSLFPKPIIITLAENKPEDEELPIINGFYKLPSGDFYPRNLFEKIQDACTNGRDPIGESIIRTGFKHPEIFNITKITSPLVHSNHAKISSYIDLLNVANFKIDETEISNLLANTYKTFKPELKRIYPDTLPYTQRVLNLRNVITKENIPRTSSSIVEFFQHIRKTPAVIELLENSLGLKMPSLKMNLLAGQGYDITKDESLLISPFKSSSYLTSDIGYYLPDILTCKLENDVANHFFQFNSIENLYLTRLKHLNIEEGIQSSTFQGKPQTGYNLNENENLKSEGISGVWERRRFQLILNDNAKLNPDFELSVNSLPSFNSSDYANVDAWKSFFSKFGTHVVKAAHGGGAIDISMKYSETNSRSITEMSDVMRSLLVRLSELSENARQSTFSAFKNTDISHTLQFRGGDYKYYMTNLFGDSVRSATSILNSWEESLNLQPTMLKTFLHLIPMSEIVKRVNPQKGIDIAIAAKALYNASLVYMPPVFSSLPPPRNETSLIVESLNAQIDKLLRDFNAERKRNQESLEKVYEHMRRENEKRDAATRKMLQESALAHERQLEQLRRDKERRASSNNPIKQWVFQFAYKMNADDDEVDALQEVMRKALKHQLVKLKEEVMLIPMEVKPGFCDTISYYINMTYIIDVS